MNCTVCFYQEQNVRVLHGYAFCSKSMNNNIVNSEFDSTNDTSVALTLLTDS